jgi:hypothetical protein
LVSCVATDAGKSAASTDGGDVKNLCGLAASVRCAPCDAENARDLLTKTRATVVPNGYGSVKLPSPPPQG